jgi:queuine tRNA-ribosyltransferase
MTLPYFEIDNTKKKSTKARLGKLITPHGIIETPAFLPVGTQATVKGLSSQDLEKLGCNIIISNAYHLYLRPGISVIEKAGGLHGFMNWDHPIATDSGGFQIASLAQATNISDEAVTFRSHIDGSIHHISPEIAINIQQRLGADIIMSFDHPVSFGSTSSELRDAMNRTHNWALRSARSHQNDSLLYSIIQGGTSPSLREESAKFIDGINNSQGIAIGGLSLGEPKDTLWEMVDISVSSVNKDKPIHLLGVGSPEDLVIGVGLGIDTFDCVLPTRIGRKGSFYTKYGRINITNAKYKADMNPVDEDCDCFTCSNFSRAYIRHLFISQELLAYTLGSIHNLRFIMNLMSTLRISIKEETYAEFRSTFLSEYKPANAAKRTEQKKLWQVNKQKTNPLVPPFENLGD